MITRSCEQYMLCRIKKYSVFFKININIEYAYLGILRYQLPPFPVLFYRQGKEYILFDWQNSDNVRQDIIHMVLLLSPRLILVYMVLE